MAFSLTEPIQVKCAVVPELATGGSVPSTLATYTNQVITVSFDPTNRNLPHPTYNGAPTIFKAIARNCASPVVYAWDFGDGSSSGDISTTDRYNLSASYQYPVGYEDVAYNAAITIVSCNGVAQTANNQAVYPVMHYGTILADQADAIRSDPAANIDLTKNYAANGVGRQWRKRMSDKAIEDGLWSLHNAVNRTGDNTAVITGNVGTHTVASTGLAMTVMQNRKHIAAYPPGTYIDATPSPTWLAESDLRYATDPYAEDLLRMLNFQLSQMSPVGIDTADESDDLSTPIPGTNDGFGLAFENQLQSYYAGPAAAALATCGMAGTLAQVGDPSRVAFKPIEFIAQQAVDYLVWAQSDGGSYPGSFYYTPNANSPDSSTSQWMYSALHAMATSPMTARGLYVNNRVKTRIGTFLRAAMKNTPLGTATTAPKGTRALTYTPGYNGWSFQLSAGPLMMMGLMGWNNPLWDNSNAITPIDAGFTSLTRGQAYTAFRQVFDYIGEDFNNNSSGGYTDGVGWSTGQWLGGAGGYNRTDDNYNLYSIQWAAKGLAAVGAVCTGGTEAQDANGACTDGNDWRHQYSVLLVRRQSVTANGGAWLVSAWTQAQGYPIQSSDAAMRNAFAILTLALAQ